MTSVHCDLILAGVGGQGGLSVATVIALAAMNSDLNVKQNEVHGMSQRGGAVVASLRISDLPVASDLVPRGTASLILSMEPLESLRYLEFLAPTGAVVTAMTPVKNIPDYPDLETLYSQIRAIPQSKLVDAEKIARDVGVPRGANMVMIGACATLLPIPISSLEWAIGEVFARKGQPVVAANLKAFAAGVGA